MRGDAAELPALARLASEAGAVLVEDAAHALGTAMDFGEGPEIVGDGRRSAMTTFSFHPVKTIATAEGGMVTTNDDRLAERLRTLRSHGMVRTPEGQGSGPAWWYEMPEIGFNYRLPDVLCALGLSQLAKLDRFAARRRQLAESYGQALAELSPLVRPAVSPPWSRPVPHLMSVLIDFAAAGRDRAAVVEALRARGVGSQVHYIPVHRQPYYAARYGPLALPGAEAWYARCLSLPLYPGMADGDVSRVVEALKAAIGH
ncbi:MAG TPA: DegT/DnrJ/EryC1/StrS family aminotransferase, partial [Phenylobacterium sp.]|uniref:DegT/DnrJ/EryC1/StrS family aminotransferase n=1 Tax=Phenylobacterium sp. TaxID=1871053 RepID=UPI002B459E45